MGAPPPPPPASMAVSNTEYLDGGWRNWFSWKAWAAKWRKDQVAFASNKAFVAARNQSTPFGLNRYVILAITVVYTMATARIYFNWPHLSGLLYHYDSYIWVCPEGGKDFRDDNKRFKCIEQDDMLMDMFLACLATAFSFSLVAGTLLDYIGPKLTGMLGQLINALAWLLFSFASETTNTYLAAFVVMGLGSDTGFLPTLPIANLFPGNEGLVVALLGAAKSASFAVPTFLMMGIDDMPSVSLKEVCLWYMGCGPLLCFCVAATIFPFRSYLPWNEFAVYVDTETGEEVLATDIEAFPPPQHRYSIHSFATHTRRGSLASVHGMGHVSSRRRSIHSHVGSVGSRASFHGLDGGGMPEVGGAVSPGEDAAMKKTGLFEASVTKCCEDNDTSAAEEVGVSMIDGKEGNVLGEHSTTAAGSGTRSVRRESKNVMVVRDDPSVHSLDEYGLNDSGEAASPVGNSVVTASFLKQFCSIFNWGITIYAVVRAIMYAFFTTSLEHLVGKDVNDWCGKALPFSFLPCILVGKLVDWFGIIIVLFVLNSCITAAYCFAMIDAMSCGYIAALFYICYVSFYSSQLYCFVSDTFEARHFGKFVGITSMVAGLLSLLKKPLQAMTSQVFNNEYRYPAIIMLGFCGFNFAIISFLFIVKRKNPHPFWPKKETIDITKSAVVLVNVVNAPEDGSWVLPTSSKTGAIPVSSGSKAELK